MKRPAVLFSCLLLAACGGASSDGSGAGDGTAPGEVLEGSVSDAMLPLDTATSQSPPLKLAAPEAAGQGAANDAADAEPAADDGAAAATSTSAAAVTERSAVEN